MGADGPPDHPDPAPNGAQDGDEGISAGQRPIPEPLQRLATLIAAAPHNLVARGDRAVMVPRHIVECDAVADRLTPTGRWMDLGTGGGLPGLVLAYRHPQVEWVLVDATAKKVDAVRRFAAELGLTNVTPVQARAETLAHALPHRGGYAGVVCRALAPLPVLVELARGFLGDGALLAAMKGPNRDAELQRAAAAIRTLRYRDVHSEKLTLPDRASWLVTMRADGPPPPGYPRRDGIPKQQPLA